MKLFGFLHRRQKDKRKNTNITGYAVAASFGMDSFFLLKPKF
jgi:hypothetical protein